jgi:hypothetical protein
MLASRVKKLVNPTWASDRRHISESITTTTSPAGRSWRLIDQLQISHARNHVRSRAAGPYSHEEGSIMFAPRIARLQQSTTAARSTSKLPPSRSALAGQFRGARDSVCEQKTRRSGDPEQIPLRQKAASPRDFSKVSIFPPSQQSSFSPLRLQAKLAVGAVNDPLEHEADRVADQVMRMPDPELSIAPAQGQLGRKCSACEEEEKAKNLHRGEKTDRP